MSKEKKEVSIIIRTKNEERWISSCLDMVFKQDYQNFEVIIVDNESTDRTIEKAKQYDVRIVSITDFLPGKAINIGIRASSGKYIVCLSGHGIPTNKQWLSNLIKNIELLEVAGVYGRQEPLSYTNDLDKRDLLIAFGLDRRVQTKDPFFHNANSIIKREVWERIPFDEETTNVEDRIWASAVLRQGYKIIYEPEASVYHYHGIHQGLDEERCRKIVGILETLDESRLSGNLDANNLYSVCIIPIKGEIVYLDAKPLLEYTVKSALESKYINKIVITTDNPEYFKLVEGLDRVSCFLRPPELSVDYLEIEDILKNAVDKLEKEGILPDIVVYLSATYPFRPPNLIDNVITVLLNEGVDSVLPTIAEYKSCWREENGILVKIDEGFVPSKYKHPMYIGISGLGTATYTSFIRKGERLGPKVGLFEINDLIYSIDVGKHNNLGLAEMIIRNSEKEDTV